MRRTSCVKKPLMSVVPMSASSSLRPPWVLAFGSEPSRTPGAASGLAAPGALGAAPGPVASRFVATPRKASAVWACSPSGWLMYNVPVPCGLPCFTWPWYFMLPFCQYSLLVPVSEATSEDSSPTRSAGATAVPGSSSTGAPATERAGAAAGRTLLDPGSAVSRRTAATSAPPRLVAALRRRATSAAGGGSLSSSCASVSLAIMSFFVPRTGSFKVFMSSLSSSLRMARKSASNVDIAAGPKQRGNF
mmetsp:Transcript_1417/g.4110  ORF Transcript_1417/g.4110 Transcript_1417/m.4110 type:complete len:247 (-) Transcript_1417:13-753(-)